MEVKLNKNKVDVKKGGSYKMDKGLQTVLGFVLFFFMLLPAIGSIIGVGEVMAFNTAKVELVQRVREGGVQGENVTAYIGEVENKFKDFEVKFYDEDGNEGVTDSEIDFGDVIEIQISAKGQGGYNFKKSKGKQEEQGVEDGKPLYKYRRTILMDRRR